MGSLFFCALISTARLTILSHIVPFIIRIDSSLALLLLLLRFFVAAIVVATALIRTIGFIEILLVISVEVGRTELLQRLRFGLDQVVLTLLLRHGDTQSNDLHINL